MGSTQGPSQPATRFAKSAIALAIACALPSCGGRVGTSDPVDTGASASGGVGNVIAGKGGAGGSGGTRPVGSGGLVGGTGGNTGGSTSIPCGPNECMPNTFCCDALCGICATPDGACPTIGCAGGFAGSAGAGGSSACGEDTGYLSCPAAFDCACMQCPGETYLCSHDEGCQAIEICEHTTPCANAQGCSLFELCGGVLNDYGGPSGPSTNLAIGLDTCLASSNCGSFCHGGGVGGAAGVGGFGGTGVSGFGGEGGFVDAGVDALPPGTTTCGTIGIPPPSGPMPCIWDSSDGGGSGNAPISCTAQCIDSTGFSYDAFCTGNQCKCLYTANQPQKQVVGQCQCAGTDPNTCPSCCPFVN